MRMSVPSLGYESDLSSLVGSSSRQSRVTSNDQSVHIQERMSSEILIGSVERIDALIRLFTYLCIDRRSFPLYACGHLTSSQVTDRYRSIESLPGDSN